jgi:hypothetical protein
MRVSDAYRAVIEPSLERIPALEVLHVEEHDGREFVVSHVLYHNVFTDFDAKLSRHLAAINGAGFSPVAVAARLRDRADPTGWHALQPMQHASIPHALAAISARALGKAPAVTLRLHHHGFHTGQHRETGLRRVIRGEDVEALQQALAVVRLLGESAFLDIAGDFDLVTVAPVGHEVPPLQMDLHEQRVLAPAPEGSGREPVSAPLFDFERAIARMPDLRAYVATVRHGLGLQKEAAVQAFRAAAEARIAAFDKALAGRALAFHRLDAVISLVTRLKAGLGDDLKGISEDARLRALDWAEAIAEEEEATGRAAARRPYPHAQPQRPRVTVHDGGGAHAATGGV